MIVCPFCHFQNEDGSLFCEQCKSDLTGVEPLVPAAPVMAETVPIAAEVVEAEVVEATPVVAEAEIVPVEVTPVEGEPVEVTPVEGEPIEVVPLAEAPMPAPAPPPPPPPPAPVVQAPPPPPPPPSPPPAPPVVQAPPPPPPPAPPAPPPPVPAPTVSEVLPTGAQPRLVVLRGLKRNAEYPIYEGPNFIGRADEKPVDIDLEDQEPPDRVWSSRQHALITFENGTLKLEDLNSSNGTFLNRNKIYPAQPQSLKPNDVIQIGTVQLKVVV